MDRKRRRISKKKLKRNFRFLLLFLVVGFFGKLGSNIGYGGKTEDKYLFIGSKNPRNAIIYSMEREIEGREIEAKKREIKEKLEEVKRIEDKDKKIAYLTFDDGPTTNITPQVLNILDDYNIKATFFVVGKLVDANPHILQDVVARGHKIGNHSYTHNYKSMYRTYDSFYEDIKLAETALKRTLGEDFSTNLIRFPGGCYGDKKIGYKNRIEEEGYSVYNWNVLNGDAEGPKKSVNYLRNRFVGTLGNKKEAVILMHDAMDKKNTVAYLPEAIEYLQSKGYEFRVLN